MLEKGKLKSAAFNAAGLGAVFVCTLSVLFMALMLTSLIPKDAIRENLKSTAEYYSSVKPFPMTENIIHSARDNYADCIVFNIISSVNENNLLYSVMSADYYVNENQNVSAGLMLSAEMDVAPNTEYSRYWHGTMIYLRPLLLLMDVRGIKIVNWLVIIGLVTLNGWLLVRKNRWEAFVFLLIGMVCVQAWYVPFCISYTSVFAIMLAASAAFVQCDEKHGEYLPALSVMTGCIACFTDFLTAETVTITVPLLMVLAVREKEGRTGSFKDGFMFILKNGAAWGISYGLTYAVKWLLALAVTGKDSVGMALDAAEVRVNGDGVFTALLRNISSLFPFRTVGDITGLYIAVLAVILICIGAAAFRKAKKKNGFIGLLAVIAAVPYLRFAVLNAHSADHCFFTYRAQIAAVMALAMGVWYVVKAEKTRKRKN